MKDRKKLVRKRKPLTDSGFVTKTGVRKIIPETHRRFWVLGAIGVALLYHSYGILSGLYSDQTIIPYDDAVILGVLEALVVPVVMTIFLWKMVVWLHDRPRSLRHVFDDPGLLD